MKYIIDMPEDKPIMFMDGEHVSFITPDKNEMNVFDDDFLLHSVKLTPYDSGDIEKARKAGQDEAWEIAKKISIMPDEDKEKVWGTAKYNTINFGYSFDEAFEKYKAWKKEKEIRVGDEINCRVLGVTGVLVRKFENDYVILRSNGMCHKWGNLDGCVKTGRHFESVEKLLQEMKGEQHEAK